MSVLLFLWIYVKVNLEQTLQIDVVKKIIIAFITTKIVLLLSMSTLNVVVLTGRYGFEEL